MGEVRDVKNYDVVLENTCYDLSKRVNSIIMRACLVGLAKRLKQMR